MQTLFFGGDVVTMEPEAQAPAQALLTENGVVRAVGRPDDLLRQAAGGVRRVDLRGAALLPAFIDAHSHFTQVAYSFLQVSLSGVRSVREIETRLAAFIRGRGLSPGAWVTAWDFDPTDMENGQPPDKAALDALCPGYLLLIRHKSGHMGWCNGAALQALGITAQTTAPAGGRIGVRDGQLTGYLEENAFFEALRATPAPDKQALLGAYRSAQALYASHGIATVQEGMCTKEMLPAYRLLLAEDLLRLDLVVFTDPTCFAEVQALLKSSGRRRCRLGGVKIFLDGSPQGRTAWMREPYLGRDPGYCGYGVMTDEAVCDAFRFAAEEKVQLLAHSNGDAACEQFLRCLAKAEAQYPVLKNLRPVLIHAQFLQPEQAKRAVALGAAASFFVAHVYHWGDVHLQNFGPARAENISPAAEAMRAGLRFTFHQDAPVIAPDMPETLWCAVCRQTKAGRTLGRRQAVSAQEALAAVTRTAAWQYGEEAKKGTLAPGKRADFVVLDRSPLCLPPEELRALRVLATYKDGEQVFPAT